MPQETIDLPKHSIPLSRNKQKSHILLWFRLLPLVPYNRYFVCAYKNVIRFIHYMYDCYMSKN